MGSTLRPLEARLVGALWAVPFGLLFVGLLSVLLAMLVSRSMPDVGPLALATMPVAAGIGWLLGPRAAGGDRWTAFGVSIAAWLLGLPLGAIALAAPFALPQANGTVQAVGWLLETAVVFLVFGGIPAVLAAVPTTLGWALLVLATTRRMAARGSGSPPQRQPGMDDAASPDHCLDLECVARGPVP